MGAYLLLFSFVWFFAVPTSTVDEKSLLDISVDSDALGGALRKESGSARSQSFDVLRGNRQRGSKFGGSFSSNEHRQQSQQRDPDVGGSFSSFTYEPISDDPEHETQKQVRSMSVV